MAKRRTDTPSARPRPVAEVVDRVLDRCGLQKRRFLFGIFASWEEIVGSRLAAHCEPLRLRGGVLEVRVDQAVWMQHLQLQKVKILEAVNRHMGEQMIRDIFWRFGALEGTGEREEELSSAHLPPLSPDTPDGELEGETEHLLQSLADPQLRETFRRLIVRAKERE
ncbi:MAG: DUF721 domain-containing protein [Desulfuromonadaceae bacterium]|nr:DUF721 domain-containing protein [Desulfuromonadaceae bacterium]